MSAAHLLTLLGPVGRRLLSLAAAAAFACSTPSCATRQIQPVTETPPYSTTTPSGADHYPSK